MSLLHRLRNLFLAAVVGLTPLSMAPAKEIHWPGASAPAQVAPARPVAEAFYHPGERTGSMHLVVIGDSNDQRHGRKLLEDVDNIENAIVKGHADAGRGSQCHSTRVVGDDVNGNTILKTIENCRVNPDDAIVVVITCHGAIDGQDRHFFSLGNGRERLFRDDVLAAMKRHNARLTVLLSDCCSNYTSRDRDGVPVVPAHSSRPIARQQGIDWKILEHLFHRHAGLIDVTAAEPGFAGAVNIFGPGSLFTNAFLEILNSRWEELMRTLDKDGDNGLQWDEVLPQLRGRAADMWRAQSPDRPQQAYAYSLGRWLVVR